MLPGKRRAIASLLWPRIGASADATEPMSEKPILIIGGGLAGVTTLYELVARGRPAVLAEANGGLAEGTSWANAGMLTPSQADPWNSPGVWRHLLASLADPYAPMKIRPSAIPGLALWGLRFLHNSAPRPHRDATLASHALAAYSHVRLAALRAELDLQFDASDAGTMKVFESEAALAPSLAIARLLEPRGLRFELLKGDRIVEVEPALGAANARFTHALYYPDDGSGDARAFTRALGEHARRLGGEIRTGVAVSRLLTQGGRVVGAATPDGDIAADAIVLAAGTASPRLARTAGAGLAIKPAKGYSLTFRVADAGDLPRLPIVDEAAHAAVTPIGDRLRAAGTAEFAGNDARVTPARIDNLLRLLIRLYPKIAARCDPADGEPWAGLRPMSADGRPFIGRTRIEGLWTNAGHGHLGWTMAAGSASLLAQLLCGEEPGMDPTPYRANR